MNNISPIDKKIASIRSQDGRRARGTCEPVVFWERLDGDIMLAPHTQMPCLPGYTKVICDTPREIEKWSRKVAKLEESKLRKMKIEEHVRALPEFDYRIKRCMARLEAGCVSQMDEAMTRHTLNSFLQKKEMLLKLITGQGSVLDGALEIERKEAPIGMAAFQKKKVAEL